MRDSCAVPGPFQPSHSSFVKGGWVEDRGSVELWLERSSPCTTLLWAPSQLLSGLSTQEDDPGVQGHPWPEDYWDSGLGHPAVFSTGIPRTPTGSSPGVREEVLGCYQGSCPGGERLQPASILTQKE